MTEDMSAAMEIEEEDDLYEPSEPKLEHEEEGKPAPDLEEGEEEDEGAAMDEDDDEDSDDSDVDIITERKDGTKAAPPSQAKYSDIRNIPQRTTSTDISVKPAPAPAKKEEDSQSHQPSALNIAAPSADKVAQAASKSTIDINGNPVYPPTGKPITAVNIDEDLADNDKPWRKPGTDISDYFNYGFDEFTWALYAAKQASIRGEYGNDAFAVNNKKMMEDFNMMMGMGGMPGTQGASGTTGGISGQQNNSNGSGGQAAGMQGGMEGMTPEMQQMMQQMMASGMDPSQMDPNQVAAMFGGQGGQGMQGGNFGGGNFGGQQGGFGYDGNMGGGGGGRGGFGGRRGRGRW